MSEILIDSKKYGDCTIGRLYIGDFQCFTLELPWLLNQRGISCVKDDVYFSKKYDSQKHGEVILLEDKHNRTFIEIHSGNYTSQIQGCILVGDSIGFLNDDGVPDVFNSKKTLKKILALLPDSFDVTIVRG